MKSVGRTTAVALDIEAPPDRIWSVLADTRSYADWNDHLRPDRPTESTAGMLRAGAIVVLRLSASQRRFIALRSTVTVAHPGYEARWVGRCMAPWLLSWEHSFDLTDGGDGTTRVLQTLTWRGLLAPVAGSSRWAAGFDHDMDALGEALRKRVGD
ncbi:conserved hypothetical protein [Catenulispora acidiphila DSM 44928]|uniref:Activator of Hsp90 ATPase 1 family protein n=1 Tax=Catenulispora acidiphila (strain DSM 44928 / JCM 14897 / NBRC 102108 / NRRL B-24433 / ID139908) TaxID=479433 RepID=C7PZB2_CATAD|nr:SRPBCC domain-containing protein [Catenulispora acidiphila]ACU71569.1 conserved hypothetical protein [Catenulispora acidiphila DSM 44928]